MNRHREDSRRLLEEPKEAFTTPPHEPILTSSHPPRSISEKQRLDCLLVSRGLVQSREQAHRLILAGLIMVDGVRVDKRAAVVDERVAISVRRPESHYVSRGGDKLAAALEALPVECEGIMAMDVGASTGGFTDCLLQRGAAHVYAVDVGYGQLDWKLRVDERVTVLERKNIRYLATEDIPRPIHLAVIDVSFISLKLVVPSVFKFLDQEAKLLALVKPQFEVGKGLVGRGGIVRDETLRTRVREDLLAFFEGLGLGILGVVDSPVPGRRGNREFFVGLQGRFNQNG